MRSRSWSAGGRARCRVPILILCLALTSLPFLASCDSGAANVASVLGEMPAQGPALRWWGAGGRIALGEERELELWLRAPGNEECAVPDPVARLADVEGLILSPVTEGAWVHREDALYFFRRYALRWMRPGSRELPGFEFRLGEDALRTQGLSFEVQAPQLPDAAGEAELLEEWIADPPPRPLWPWLLGGGAVLALGLLLTLWMRRRAVRPSPIPSMPPPPPRDVALGRLRQLGQLLDHGEIDGEALVVEVARVLRSWLQDGLGIHALERTTEEFLQELQSSGRLPRELQHRLAAFLEDSDLVKFAGQHADLTLCRSLLMRAQELVEAT
jgi:hypothetical protein